MNIAQKRTLYNVIGSPFLRNFGMPWQGRASILCYHRICKDTSQKELHPNGNLISKSAFTNQMKILHSEYDVISMDEMLVHLSSNSKDFKVAVTFDDGYKDNLFVALPVLEKFKIPATIYIVTRFPEGDNWMWWYEIWDNLVIREELVIKYKDKTKFYNLATLEDKKNCFVELTRWIIDLVELDQKDFMHQITNSTKRKQYPELCLNWNEIKSLSSNKLITIGSHSHTHPKFINLSSKEVIFEINKSRSLLEEKLSKKINHFAYPFGGVNDVGSKDQEILKKCGFDSAVTTIKKPIEELNTYLIPRTLVQEYLSENGFRAILSGWGNLLCRINT